MILSLQCLPFGSLYICLNKTFLFFLTLNCILLCLKSQCFSSFFLLFFLNFMLHSAFSLFLHFICMTNMKYGKIHKDC